MFYYNNTQAFFTFVFQLYFAYAKAKTDRVWSLTSSILVLWLAHFLYINIVKSVFMFHLPYLTNVHINLADQSLFIGWGMPAYILNENVQQPLFEPYFINYRAPFFSPWDSAPSVFFFCQCFRVKSFKRCQLFKPMWELDFTHWHQLHWVIKELICFVLLERTILLTWREGVSVETDIWHLTVWTIAGSGRVKLRMWQSSDINALDSTEPRFITINVVFVSSHWPDLNLMFLKRKCGWTLAIFKMYLCLLPHLRKAGLVNEFCNRPMY